MAILGEGVKMGPEINIYKYKKHNLLIYKN